MKRIIYLIVGLLILPIGASALSGNVGVECAKDKIAIGDSVTCDLTLTITEGEVKTFSASLVGSSELTATFVKEESWTGDNSSTIALTSTINKTGTVTIGVITLTSSNTATAGNKSFGLTEIKIGDGTNFYNIANNSQNMLVMSNVNTLSEIKIDNTALSNFSSTVTNYSYTTKNESITIAVTKTDENSVIFGDTGSIKLNYGINKLNIYVNSESGIRKNYSITVTREDTRNTDNTLSNIVLSNGELNFSSDKLEYDVDVASTIDKISITSTLSNNKARFSAGLGNRTVNLVKGINKVEISVIAENETVKVYTLNITREDDRKADISLSLLTINNKNIVLTKGLYEYEVTLKYKEEMSKLAVTANDITSKVEFEDIKLEVGTNELKFKVTAENETEQEYVLKITRLSEEDSKVYLEKIIAMDYELNFDKNINTYDLTIDKDTNNLQFNILPNDEDLKVSISGNSELKNGSVITINVTDDSGDKTYTINIHKANENVVLFGFLPLEILCYGVFGLGVILFGVSIIFAIKKSKKQEN